MELLKELKDIKPNVNIVDYQFYIFIGFVVLVIILLIYLIFKFLKKKKQNPYLIKLKNLNFNDSKKTAYEFSEYAKYFINEENKSFYEELVSELEKYKYKPIVDDLNEEIVSKIKKFIEGIKWVSNIPSF